MLFRRIAKFRKLTLREQILFLEALLLHLWTGLLLKIIPFRWIPRVFSSPQSPVNNRQSELIELVKVAVHRAGRFSPWRNKCLVSSLVARKMLKKRRIPSKLSLGVAKDTAGRTVAHAWLISGEIEITGKQGDYQELFVF